MGYRAGRLFAIHARRARACGRIVRSSNADEQLFALDDDRNRVQSALGEVGTGSRHVVLFSGEAGVGKIVWLPGPWYQRTTFRPGTGSSALPSGAAPRSMLAGICRAGRIRQHGVKRIIASDGCGWFMACLEFQAAMVASWMAGWPRLRQQPASSSRSSMVRKAGFQTEIQSDV